MRIALVHSFYSSNQSSGENVVVQAQAAALRSHGFEVKVIGANTDELESRRGYKVRTAINVASGRGLSPISELEEFAPDIVHVHNLFPNWGSSWLGEWQGPLIATVHNFRPVCAAGTLFRDGRACTLCPDGNPLEAVRHACYRDSILASLPLAIRNIRGIPGDKLLSRADKVILLSPRARDIYVSFGLPASRAVVIPNFVADVGFIPLEKPGIGWVYIGRLTEEKGVINLLKHWPEDEKLKIYGEGPLKRQVEAAQTANITYGGQLPHGEIPRVLRESLGLIFPSEWAEGLPLVYAEALASGRPVVAKAGNSAADDVAEAGTGVVFDKWSSIKTALNAVALNQIELSVRAREHFEQEYSLSTWLETTLNLYKAVEKDRSVA
jgi:glycosyltransferase involved in cell wall biosynthesis